MHTCSEDYWGHHARQLAVTFSHWLGIGLDKLPGFCPINLSLMHSKICSAWLAGREISILFCLMCGKIYIWRCIKIYIHGHIFIHIYRMPRVKASIILEF